MRTEDKPKCLYIFLDEGGNLDFSKKGTKYFTLTAVTRTRPFLPYPEFVELKYDILESGVDTQYFHATEDRQDVRDRVFEVIKKHVKDFRIDCIVAEKSKTHPTLYDAGEFYGMMLGCLLKYIVRGYDLTRYNHVIVMTDRLPLKKHSGGVMEAAIKGALAKYLPQNVGYRVMHHESKSNFNLQIADYCNWAIYRKWSMTDFRSYKIIQSSVRSEFDIFRKGQTNYY